MLGKKRKFVAKNEKKSPTTNNKPKRNKQTKNKNKTKEKEKKSNKHSFCVVSINFGLQYVLLVHFTNISMF